MEAADTLTPPLRSAGSKTKRARSNGHGPMVECNRATSLLSGLSLHGLSQVSRAYDAQADHGGGEHLDRCIAEVTFESSEGVLVADADLRTLRVNTAFSRITGYSQREAIGERSPVLVDIRECLERSGGWNDEVTGRKKGGEAYTALLRVTSIVDAQGRVTHYIATMQDLSTHKALQKRITHLGFTDSLTGLKNRAALLISLQRAIDKCREQQVHAAVLLVDIDDFRGHNVRLGHLAGDRLLQQSAQRLGQALGSGVAMARLCADKFLVVLEELGGSADDAQVRAQRRAACVRDAFAQAFSIDATPVYATVSMGLCLIGAQDDLGADVLIDRAEMVTYDAKQGGGDCLFSFEFGAIEHEA